MEKEKNRIQDILQYIEANLKEPEALTLEKISTAAGYSRFHLNRIFSASMGCTIHQYIIERHLSEAASLLSATNRSIIEIAYDCGYQSQPAFTSAFRQLYGCSPYVYRRFYTSGKEVMAA